MSRTLIVVHIPKTAGTTLRTIVSRQVPEERLAFVYRNYITRAEFAALPDRTKRNYDLVMGHFAFGLHRDLPPGQDWSYAALVRDPMKRSISWYNQAANKRRPGSRNRLDRFERGESWRSFDNVQVRMISGMPAQSGQVNDDMLRTAMANIATHFAWVGITDRFDESLYLATKTLDWVIPPFRDRNLGSDRPRDYKSGIPAADLARMADMNVFDQKLYEFVTRRFDAALRAQGERHVEEIAQFRRQLQKLRRPPAGWRRSRTIFGWAWGRRSRDADRVKD